MKQLANKIVYELYPSSFYDSNGDGIGDLGGIIAKLDYLATLGIDLIWITPIFKSPKNDNGYDISNYYEIDPSFGTLEDVEKLISEAKKHQIGIMFDMVFNHVSTSSKWFEQALKGDQKYQDYFYIIKSDDLKNPPNNWVSKFGGSAWKYQSEFQGYYLHLFDVSQADLNWNNPQVRQELTNVVNFWINKGIAGFRFDVINLIGKPEQLIDSDDFGKSLYTDHPNVHQFLKELNQNSFGRFDDLITVGEMSSTTIANAVKYSDPGEKELDMIFSFHHLKVDYQDGQKWLNQPWDKKMFKNLIQEWQVKLDQKGHNAIFLNNHDQPRVNSRYGDVKNHWFASSTVFATMMFFLQGTVFIYQGEEIGMTNPDYQSINQYRDVESVNTFKFLKSKGWSEAKIIDALMVKSRDNSRSPMQWNNLEYAGFSKVKPWIDVATNYQEINVAKQINDPNSVFNFYKKLIEIRKTNSTVIHGSIDFIDSNENLMIFQRTYQKQKLMICLNLSNQEQNCNLSQFNENQILINNYQNFDKMKLNPFQVIVFEINNEK